MRDTHIHTEVTANFKKKLLSFVATLSVNILAWISLSMFTLTLFSLIGPITEAVNLTLGQV